MSKSLINSRLRGDAIARRLGLTKVRMKYIQSPIPPHRLPRTGHASPGSLTAEPRPMLRPTRDTVQPPFATIAPRTAQRVLPMPCAQPISAVS